MGDFEFVLELNLIISSEIRFKNQMESNTVEMILEKHPKWTDFFEIYLDEGIFPRN